MEKAVLFLLGIDAYTFYTFVFSTHKPSANITIHGLTEYLIYHHCFPKTIASDQGTHFTAKKLWQWAHAQGILWSYYVLHHLEVLGLIEM